MLKKFNDLHNPYTKLDFLLEIAYAYAYVSDP